MKKRTILKRYIFGDFSIKRIIVFPLFLYICFVLFTLFYSDKMIFVPHSASYEIDNKNFILLERNGSPDIAITYFKNPKANMTILYSHGNAEDLGDIFSFLNKISQLGFSAISYDYQGYGQTDGIPSEKNCYNDIDFIFNYATNELQIPQENIIIWGRSVGSGPACELARRYKTAGLILDSPFISTFRVITHYSILPFDKFKNLEKIDKIDAPILIIHGRMDKVIPFWHGQKLYEKIKTTKSCLWIENAGHNNLRYINSQLYWDKISLFTQKLNL